MSDEPPRAQCSLVNPPGARRCDCGYDLVRRPAVSSPAIGIGGSLRLALESTARGLVGSSCIAGPLLLMFGYDELPGGALVAVAVFVLLVYASVLSKWRRQGLGFIWALGRDTVLTFLFVLIGAISGVGSAFGGPALHMMGPVTLVFPLVGFLIVQRLGRAKKTVRPN